MMLFLPAIFIVVSGVLISLCWKVAKGVAGLTSKMIRPSPIPVAPDYFSDNTDAIWLKSHEGQYFRYDLRVDSIESPAKYDQIDSMSEFLNAYGRLGKEYEFKSV